MASFTWKGGKNEHRLKLQVEGEVEKLRQRSVEALELSVADGAELTQDYLERAVTKTGLRREQDWGGLPGRHDSGDMVGSVSYEVENPRARKVIRGRFGWWGANFEEYFRDQDQGEGDIPAARALPQAEVVARENLRQRMSEVVRGRRVS